VSAIASAIWMQSSGCSSLLLWDRASLVFCHLHPLWYESSWACDALSVIQAFACQVRTAGNQ
jgi:hypothetical protein